MSTRERILDTALARFNEEGTAAVSTNHIAVAAGISPGNLYYHFRSKGEIIRALCERQFAAADQLYDLPGDRPPALADLRRLVRATFVMHWDFRFIYRELIALLRRDERLHRRWLEVRQRGFDGFRALFAAFVAAGVLRPAGDSDEVARLAELCWLISEFWVANVEVGGRTLDAAQLDRGVVLLHQVLEPFVIEDGSEQSIEGNTGVEHPA